MQRPTNIVTLTSLIIFAALPARSEFTVARFGNARCVIVQQAEATETEQTAARELADRLQKITGARFVLQTANGTKLPKNVIIVGPGEVASQCFPETGLTKLGPEEFVMRVKDGQLLLAGGRPRGTLYAVYHFLQEQCGVRWWTPWATNIPRHATLRIPDLDVRQKPAFEYRAPYWYCGFDPLWKTRNGANGESQLIPKNLGGCVQYKGFCHTFYPLVPPEKYFAQHPEWYSLLKGKRTHERAQLCLSNPQLRDFVVGRVKEWLRESPDAEIISLTQNDWFGACECPNCKAIDDAEGSPSGSMIAFVNYVAEKIEPEFPHVAVDTFAYQYTRKPPKNLKPRSNVIVRLCSIECNFREPLDHPSNASFLADLHGWAKICLRLYIWDYTTDFANYVNPHPNWFTLGANVRLFQTNNVRGVFEQGAYGNYGGEMGELRAWLLARLLWNPQRDDRALIKEFLEGYYGKAAEPIGRYLELMHRESKDFYLGCYLRKDPPHLRFEVLAEVERLWQQAEKAVSGNREILARVRVSHLPVRYAILSRWASLRRECWEQNGTWPLAESRKAVADEFRKACEGVPGKNWTRVKLLNEQGLTVEKFLEPLAIDPPSEKLQPPVKRLTNPGPPNDIPREEIGGAVDLQDNIASLARPGQWAEITPDERASDGRAVRMPGNHSEWAFRIKGAKIPSAPNGKWKVYAAIRVERSSDTKPDGVAFSAGIFDESTRTYPGGVNIQVSNTSENYRSYLIATYEPNAHRDIFVAPVAAAALKAIWVDRIYLVPSQ